MVAAAQSRSPAPAISWDWLGLLPFLTVVTTFLIVPAMVIVQRSLLDNTGHLTFAYWLSLGQEAITLAYRHSLLVSLITALSGAVLGGMLSWAITLGKLPATVRSSVLSFCGVAANFAGVPLVFAFMALLGRVGLINQWLRPLGATLDPQTFLYGFWGLCIVYTYFQIPLTVLIMVPALQGLRQEWQEAAENLGATPTQFWLYVGFPVLLPSILGALSLLFANAFSTYATAIALLGGMGQVFAVTVVVANQFRTDTFADPGLGYALAASMIVVIGLTILVYIYSRRLAEQWRR
ncbi:MAG: ABC transporter permease subunit [Synechococcales cyanobacterium]